MLRLLRNLLLLSVITIVLLILLEGTVRFVSPQDSKITFIDNQSTGLEDSTLGYVLRPGSGSTVRTPEYAVEYKINQEGMRDESFHSNPNTPAVTRILLLGDSFTYGEANPYDEIWPVIFEQNIVEKGYKVDVIKAGVPGYDTQKELLYLKRLFPLYKPDIVVFVMLPNDIFTNTPLEDRGQAGNDWTVRATADKVSLLHSLTLFKRILLANDYLYTKLYNITPRSQYFSFPINDKLNKQIKITKELVLEAANYCKERNAEFIVLSIPQQFQVLVKSNDYRFDNIEVDNIDKIFLEYSRENGFLWIPTLTVLSDEYKKTGNDQYFRLDGHLNNNGNLLIGNYFSNEFIEILNNRLSLNEIK